MNSRDKIDDPKRGPRDPIVDYALLISVWKHTQDLQVARLGNVLICRPASKSRRIVFNATGWTRCSSANDSRVGQAVMVCSKCSSCF